jgi:hypothetical protein
MRLLANENFVAERLIYATEMIGKFISFLAHFLPHISAWLNVKIARINTNSMF